MNRTNLTALTLSAVLALSGCSTTVNGEDPQMSNAGKIVAGLIVVGALTYALSRMDNDEPDATITTTGPYGTTTSDVYLK